MKKIKIFTLMGLCLSLMACNGLKRGVDGSTYVSTGKPSFSVAVPSLPLRTSGSINASITTSNNLGGVPINAWIAVYGGDNIEQPMAIISQASIKSPYYFDYNSIKFNSIARENVSMGKFNFQACTYLITNMQKNAFVALTPGLADINKDNEQKTYIIVRSFATRTDFDEGKIILEYREKAPDNFEDIKALPFGAQTFLEEFNKRAMSAFVFDAQNYNDQNIKNIYAQGIATRYLDENFWGSVSYHDPYD